MDSPSEAIRLRLPWRWPTLTSLSERVLLGRVRSHSDGFRARLAELCDLAIVADLRGDGYFLAVELDTDGPSDPVKGLAYANEVSKYLTKRMYGLGLTCRAAARGAVPVIQLSPPLVAGPRAVRPDCDRHACCANRCHVRSSPDDRPLLQPNSRVDNSPGVKHD